MTRKSKNLGKEIEGEIKKLIGELKKYDGIEDSREREEEPREISDRLASIGKPAVPQLIALCGCIIWRGTRMEGPL
jgi:hypothetical protein